MSDTKLLTKNFIPLNSEQSGTLREQIILILQRYFSNLGDLEPRNLYDLVIDEVEGPLFEAVLRFTGNNQSETARILGLARGTVRKKLKRFGLIEGENIQHND